MEIIIPVGSLGAAVHQRVICPATSLLGIVLCGLVKNRYIGQHCHSLDRVSRVVADYNACHSVVE